MTDMIASAASDDTVKAVERLSPEYEAEIRSRVAALDATRSFPLAKWTAGPVTEKSSLPPEQFAVEDILRTEHSLFRVSVGVFGAEPEAAFTAAAREDIPALLVELDRMRAVLRDACDQIVGLEYELGGATAQVAALEAARRTTEQGAVRAAAAWQKAEARVPTSTRPSDPLEAGRRMVREAEASNTRACRHCSQGCHRASSDDPWTHDSGRDGGHAPEPFKLPQIPPASAEGGQS